MITKIQALDTDLKPLKVGDEVRFAMPGFFQAASQEATGRIAEIDDWGGISIEVSGQYSLFTSTGAVAATTEKIYFIHHIYDSEKRARIYHSPQDPKLGFIVKIAA